MRKTTFWCNRDVLDRINKMRADILLVPLVGVQQPDGGWLVEIEEQDEPVYGMDLKERHSYLGIPIKRNVVG